MTGTSVLVRDYVDALLDVERDPAEADRVIALALSGGADPRLLLLDVIPAALHEIGDRWQAGKISTGDEHLATSVAQGTMRALATRLERRPRLGLSIVIAAVAGELHDNGPRLLADLVDADGWDVFLCGAATPVSSLVRLVDERRPAVVALAITLPRHLPALEAAVRALKTQLKDPPMVIVGGQGCVAQDNLAERLGADAYARTVEEALLLISQAKSGGDDRIRTGA